jgi:hypothetical protein
MKIRHLFAACAVGLLSSGSLYAHDDAQWIEHEPSYVGENGRHCCGPSACMRLGELTVVASAFLQRHGVPCENVDHVETAITDFDLVVTCEDKRQWALFFVEGEVEFVQPVSREPYRWQREVYLKYPQVYGGADAGPKYK